MSGLARVAGTVSFPDDPAMVLDYLAQRTSETVGRRIDRADAVVVGNVSHVESGVVAAGDNREINLGLARLTVERRLAGDAQESELTLVHPRTARVTAPPIPEPSLRAGDRGLFFVQKIGDHLPYATAIASPSYHLADLQDLVAFQTEDVDEYGRLVARDQTPLVEELADAVEWYAALPDGEQARCAALVLALDRPNARIEREAVRSLANLSCSGGAEAIDAAMEQADGDFRIRLMLGLWLMGRRPRARELLNSFYYEHGKDAWLATWSLAHSLDAEGQRVAVLFGPAPSEAKGD